MTEADEFALESGYARYLLIKDRTMTEPIDTVEAARCALCGEPMPEGEAMFKYHGYSGPCPAPPLPSQAQPESEAEARTWTYIRATTDDPAEDGIWRAINDRIGWGYSGVSGARESEANEDVRRAIATLRATVRASVAAATPPEPYEPSEEEVERAASALQFNAVQVDLHPAMWRTLARAALKAVFGG